MAIISKLSAPKDINPWATGKFLSECEDGVYDAKVIAVKYNGSKNTATARLEIDGTVYSVDLTKCPNVTTEGDKLGFEEDEFEVEILDGEFVEFEYEEVISKPKRTRK